MFWADRLNRVTGVTLLLIPVLSIVGFIGGAATGEVDPFAREQAEPMLRAIHDNHGLFLFSLVPFALTDILVLPVAAALLYLAFRDRSQTLAIVSAFAILAAVAAYVVHLTAVSVLAMLAADFFDAGAPRAIPTGTSAILQSARMVSLLQAFAALFAQTATGFGLMTIGGLIAWAPAGQRNPPPWIGKLGIVGGIGSLCTWTFLLNHNVGGAFTLIGELAVLFMMGALGAWLLRQPDVLDPALATPIATSG